MVLAWTMADTRYRFRIKTAPLPLEMMTFWIVTVVGFLTLLTDLWRAEGLPVIKGNLITPAAWQALLAGLFFITFITWVWFAFVRPSVFSSHTAKRYGNTLYSYILGGVKGELSIIADELARSGGSLIKHAQEFSDQRQAEGEGKNKPKEVDLYANDILALISDKRFCKSVVESSPFLIYSLFTEINKTKKYRVNIKLFARNVFEQALLNDDSFMYHESGYFDSGLIGHLKPLSSSIFKNFEMVEYVSMIYDIDYEVRNQFTPKQFEAYCRAFILTFESYAEMKNNPRSYVINRCLENIIGLTYDIYLVNGMEDNWKSVQVLKLKQSVSVLKEMINLLSKSENDFHYIMRVKKGDEYLNRSIYDEIASAMFEIIFNVSAVREPFWTCWSIQHNTVLNGFFRETTDCKAKKIILYKLRRLVFNEVIEMEKYPNFKGAKIIGFFLNVLGLEVLKNNFDRATISLQRSLLSWLVKNYSILRSKNVEVADVCLLGNISFDEENCRLVKTYPTGGLRTENKYIYLKVNP